MLPPRTHTIGWKLREYAKLIRSFNAGLTGIAPVLGALSMGVQDLLVLFILFIIGFLSHIYGFVLNDCIDIPIDKCSPELAERPLVSGTISLRAAATLAVSAMGVSWLFCIVFLTPVAFVALVIGDLFATVYNMVSKRAPGMDWLVAGAVFFLILTGACSCIHTINELTLLAYIVATIGFLQVMFMNAINGGLKDIDHDSTANAKTLAVALGVKVDNNNRLRMVNSFRACGYGIAITHIACVFLPFVCVASFAAHTYFYYQISILALLAVATFAMATKLLTLKVFNRNKVRRIIGMHVIFMYALTPVMLYSAIPWAALLAFFPPLWFIGSNLLLHRTTMTAKTM